MALGFSEREPRQWKVQSTLTDEVPVIWPEPTHAESCNVYKMKSFGRRFPVAKCGCGVLTCTKRFVNLVRNAYRLASPRQTYDASDVVLAFAGQGIDCNAFISMACVNFGGVISW